MYAIIENGGKQYKAVPGSNLDLDRMQKEEGSKITLDNVLLISDGDEITIGTPTIKGAKVKATILEHFKGRKIIVFKYIPRERYRRKKGHRQHYTRLKIDEITVK